MIYLKRVAQEIKDIGLYDLVLQDVEKILNKSHLTTEDILEAIKTNPQILKDYKQINVEYNIGNIHLSNINTTNIDIKHQDKALKINKNLEELRELEKYTLDFEQSATLVIIFSIEFFVLFSAQYFIVLLDLKEWQLLIYGIFASSIVVAYLYAKKEEKKYTINNLKFNQIYDETLNLIEELEDINAIKKEDMIIKESDEHI